MLSTMQDGQLSLAQLLRYGTTVHSTSEVITWTDGGATRKSYGEVGRRAAQLANALRSLGVTGDQRVGTFMWNNAEHLETYLAVPAMGAVLHTLNIRLFPEQLNFVVNHAEDHAIIVDGTLAPLLAKNLPEMKTVRHVIISTGEPDSVETPDGIEVHSYQELLDGQPETFDWPELDERSTAAMCYTSGTTGDPKGVAYSHRSIWLHSMHPHTVVHAGRQHAGDRADVPRHVLGTAVRRADGRRIDDHARSVPAAGGGRADSRRGETDDGSRRANDLARPAAAPGGQPAGHLAPARSHRRRLGRPTRDDARFRGELRGARAACVGHDRDLPARQRGPATREHQRRTCLVVSLHPGPIPRIRTCAADRRRRRGVPWDGSSVGELEVRGPWIAGSYYGTDVDPEKVHDGWLRTGDVGHITSDGFLTLTDRAKDVIESGGEWISSVDLENHVMAHPDVSEAAVIGVPDEKWDERPLVAVVRCEGSNVSPQLVF